MLKEFYFYHGAVLARLIHSNQPVSIKLYPTASNASYVVNEKVGFFIKHSSKRMSPWRFSFHKTHQDEILEMKNKLDEVFVVLVCHDDGFVTLSFEELKNLLNDTHEEMEWVSVSRNPREKYTLKGSDGKLKYKIGDNEFPSKILNTKLKRGKKIFTWFD